MKKGFFITLEGVDAAGKSSHLEALKEYLEKTTGRQVVLTREPGGTPLAEQLRLIVKTQEMSPETETLLLNAGRKDHLENVILPAIAEGKIVLCDRFSDSTFAYQGGGKKMTFEKVNAIKEWTQEGVEPDLTLYFDVPLEVSKARREKRGEASDRFEEALDANFQALRDVYIKLAKANAHRIKVVDGTEALESVRSAVLNHINAFLSGHKKEASKTLR